MYRIKGLFVSSGDEERGKVGEGYPTSILTGKIRGVTLSDIDVGGEHLGKQSFFEICFGALLGYARDLFNFKLKHVTLLLFDSPNKKGVRQLL
jgi:hypothetical protein